MCRLTLGHMNEDNVVSAWIWNRRDGDRCMCVTCFPSVGKLLFYPDGSKNSECWCMSLCMLRGGAGRVGSVLVYTQMWS